jgi:hypothetical protein
MESWKLAVFPGTIAAAQAGGVWSVSGKLSPWGAPVTISGTNPDEIKGWMSLGSVAGSYGIAYAELLAQFDLPADTAPTTPIKELESETFWPDLLRTWLTERMTPDNSRQAQTLFTRNPPGAGRVAVYVEMAPALAVRG